MADFGIGLSGLNAVQKALNTVGNNIANAATEGYHKQRVEMSPSYYSAAGSITVGGGVEIKGITRVIDSLLEQEICRQQSESAMLSQQDSTLRTIENIFGDFSTEQAGLNAIIDKFFNSLQDLSTNPKDNIWLNQFVSNANAMAGQFRIIGEYLTSLQTQIRTESENVIGTINTYTQQIANLNDRIEALEMVNNDANSLCDQRDKLISDLSKLIGVETISRENGVVDVITNGLPLVTGSASSRIEFGLNDSQTAGITIEGGSNYVTDVRGGKLGGLLSLKNEIISDIQQKFDTLAAAIMQEINKYHVQGVGTAGAFTSLTGWPNVSERLADFSNVTDGSVYIRVTNTATGEVLRSEIPVNSSTDSLSDIVEYINTNIANLTASLSSSNQLTIKADNGYEFDFRPCPASVPDSINFNGTTDPDVTISGFYEGSNNDTLTFSVVGTGEIGNDSLELIVTDSSLNEIARVNIGNGYAPGDNIPIGNTGIRISLGTGDLAAGDSFSIAVFSDTDTSGLLAATGINTFFTGTGAIDMEVGADILDNPARIATMLGADMTDNFNVRRMYELRDKSIAALGGISCNEFYREMTTGIGQDLYIIQTRKDNVEAMLLNLTNQQSEISGVDVNEESAQLLMYQQMFQSLAKYMSTVNETLKSIMDII